MIFVRNTNDEDQPAGQNWSAGRGTGTDIFVRQKTSNSMEPSNEKKFFPKGAIAFFILLVLLSLVFWYGIYWLMIERT